MNSPARPHIPPIPLPPPAGDDEALVRQVRAGDERAFEAIYHRYREPLHRYCHSILRQREDAEEALQATMLAAYQALSSGDRRELALRPWLYRIAHNACVSALRRRSAREAEPLGGEVPAPGGVEERSELSARLRELRRDLDQLEERPRAALLMRELGGLSHVEIGQALGEPPAAVKQLVYQARVALHDLAAGRELACETVRRTISDGDGRLLRGRALRSHLRSCAGCGRFRESLRTRPAMLVALVPALPPESLREILAAVVSSGGSAGALAGAGAAGGGGLAAIGLGAGAASSGVAGALAVKIAVVGSVSLLGGTVALIPTRDAPRAPAAAGEPAAALSARQANAAVFVADRATPSTPVRLRPVTRRAPAGPERQGPRKAVPATPPFAAPAHPVHPAHPVTPTPRPRARPSQAGPKTDPGAPKSQPAPGPKPGPKAGPKPETAAAPEAAPKEPPAGAAVEGRGPEAPPPGRPEDPGAGASSPRADRP